MDDQDTQATEPASPERAAEVATESGRDDNRNDEVEGSPVPDPTATDSGADDIPDAD
jgi:hypothetical protein